MGDHKKDLIELKCMRRRTRHREVSNMDWVKSATENADSCHLGHTFGAL